MLNLKPTLFLLFLLLLGVALDAQTRPDSVYKMNPRIKLLENPVHNKMRLQVKDFAPGKVQVLISNTARQLVYSEQRLITGSVDEVVLFLRLPPGNYVCLLEQAARRTSVRFLVE
jgi:hypothetical protein